MSTETAIPVNGDERVHDGDVVFKVTLFVLGFVHWC